MSSSPLTHNHHVVPKFLLRRFADDRGKLLEADEWLREAVPKAPKTAGVIVDFNIGQTDSGATDYLERALGPIETRAAQAIGHLVDQGQEMTGGDLEALANFVAAQITRGPKHRDRVTSRLRRTAEGTAGSASPESVRRYLRNEERREPTDAEVEEFVTSLRSPDLRWEVPREAAQLEALKDATALVAPLSQWSWSLITAEVRTFAISDSGVTVWPLPVDGRPAEVLQALAIILPTDPCHAVLAQSAFAGSALPDLTPDVVNRWTRENAFRYIYAHPEPASPCPPANKASGGIRDITLSRGRLYTFSVSRTDHAATGRK